MGMTIRPSSPTGSVDVPVSPGTDSPLAVPIERAEERELYLASEGRLSPDGEAEEARTEQALLGYEQTVLLALEEVENALVAFEQEKRRRDRLSEAVSAAQRSVDIVRTQYLSGLTDFWHQEVAGVAFARVRV